MAAAFVFFMIPETKNLTLEEMDEVFGDEAGNAIEDRNRLNRIYLELGLLAPQESDASSTTSKNHSSAAHDELHQVEKVDA